MKKVVVPIIDIREETYEAKTFRLANTSQLSFVPGQYCLVSILNHPKFAQVARPFTFSSSPTHQEWFEITVKKMGEFTSTLFECKLGDTLEIKGPRGEKLNFTEAISEDLVFLAGGSGITPFMATIRYVLAKKLPNSITLFYGNRSERDIIFANELNTMDSKRSKVVHILEQAEPSWMGERGRIQADVFEKYIPDISNKLWFVCGPPPMTIAMKKILQSKNIPESAWRIEPWEVPGKA